MGRSVPKQFLEIRNKPVLVHCLAKFESCNFVDGIVLVVPLPLVKKTEAMLREFRITKVSAVTAGGERRQDSVFCGLRLVPSDTDYVLIHDGVRPCIRVSKIEEVVQAMVEKGAAMLALPVTETIKRVRNGKVAETLDRTALWQAQTPQGFKREYLKKAYALAGQERLTVTDDASLVELLGVEVAVVEGDPDNIKITSPLDLIIAERILEPGT